MLESFKLKATELRRYLKIHIALPKDYHENDNSYPMVLVLDGQYYYDFLGEETKVFDTNKMLEPISDKALFFFIHSPAIPAWRISELNPYYNGSNKDVDKVLSVIYFDYLVNIVIPLLKERYRINDNIYIAGIKDSAIAAIYMLYQYNIFRGAAVYDINLSEVNDKFHEDMKYKFTCKKSVYLFHGGLNSDSKEDDLFYHLCQRFESYKTEILKYDFNSELDNSFASIEEVFADGISHIMKNNLQ